MVIVARSVSLNRPHWAISGRVRRQPRHSPLAPSTMQTLMHGVEMGWDGAEGVAVISEICGGPGRDARPRA